MLSLLDTLYTPFAFALTYLFHSTVWILLVAVIVKLPIFQSIALRNLRWKFALIGGIMTSCFAFSNQKTNVAIPIVIDTESVTTKGITPELHSNLITSNFVYGT